MKRHTKIVGALLILLLLSVSALAVDPDMQALVIDNGSGMEDDPVVPAPGAIISALIGLGSLRFMRLRRHRT